MKQSEQVHILDARSGKAVQASLIRPIGEKHIQDWEKKWKPAHEIAIERLLAAGVPVAAWPQHRGWDWAEKAKSIKQLLSFPSYALECDGLTQGLMIVNLSRVCRLPAHGAKPLVYIEFIESAPWNRPQLGSEPRYRGIGTVLFTAAINLSDDEGYHGRVGLHSLPQADAFYRNKCGMTEIGPDKDYKNLRYFELTSDQAKAWAGYGGENAD
jgi:hypothetical protein